MSAPACPSSALSATSSLPATASRASKPYCRARSTTCSIRSRPRYRFPKPCVWHRPTAIANPTRAWIFVAWTWCVKSPSWRVRAAIVSKLPTSPSSLSSPPNYSKAAPKPSWKPCRSSMPLLNANVSAWWQKANAGATSPSGKTAKAASACARFPSATRCTNSKARTTLSASLPPATTPR